MVSGAAGEEGTAAPGLLKGKKKIAAMAIASKVRLGGIRGRILHRPGKEGRRLYGPLESRATFRRRFATGQPPIETAKAVDGLRPSFSAHVRLGERGAPVDFLRRGYDTDRGARQGKGKKRGSL